MKIENALQQCDDLKPNMFSPGDKILWLSILDGIIKKEIIDTHEGYDDIVFNGYDDNTPLDTELLVPEPYSDVYIKWLFSQIDFNNAEFDRYNNSMMMYNTAYVQYANWYNRTHMPLQSNKVSWEG